MTIRWDWLSYTSYASAQDNDDVVYRPGPPISRHRTVIGLAGPSRDVDHVRQDPALAMGALTVGLAQPTPGAQAFGQPAAQRATRLHIQGLVDRFGGHPHLRVIGVATSKSASDLLG